MTMDELQHLKRKLKESEDLKNQTIGKIEQLTNELKNKFKVNSLKEAIQLNNSYEEEIKKLTDQLEELLQESDKSIYF